MDPNSEARWETVGDWKPRQNAATESPSSTDNCCDVWASFSGQRSRGDVFAGLAWRRWNRYGDDTVLPNFSFCPWCGVAKHGRAAHRVSHVLTLFDGPDTREKATVMDLWDVMLDDSRNPDFTIDCDSFYEWGKSYRITVEEVESRGN